MSHGSVLSSNKIFLVQDELRDGAAVLRFISTIGDNGEDLINDVEDFVEREETTPKTFVEEFKGQVRFEPVTFVLP